MHLRPTNENCSQSVKLSFFVVKENVLYMSVETSNALSTQHKVQSEPYGSFCTFARLAKGSRNVTSHNVVGHEVKRHHTQLDAGIHV